MVYWGYIFIVLWHQVPLTIVRGEKGKTGMQHTANPARSRHC